MRKIKIGFKDIIDQTGLIFLEVFIADKSAIMIVDTGCINNIIDIGFIKNDLGINLVDFTKSKVSIFNEDKEIEKANVTIANVSIEKQFKTVIDFTVIDMSNTTKTFLDDYGIEVIGILGNNFLKTNKLKINYKNNYIEYEDND